MQATLQLQAAAAAPVARRTQQTRALAGPCTAPQQPRVNAPKVGAITPQRNVAAHAKGAIKPMEATFTEFTLVDKSKKVRGALQGRGAPLAAASQGAARGGGGRAAACLQRIAQWKLALCRT